MSETGMGESTAQEGHAAGGRSAEADRRAFMRRVFLAGGAAAFTAMGGAGAVAFADEGSTAAPSAAADDSATPSPSASPTRGNGGGGA